MGGRVKLEAWERQGIISQVKSPWRGKEEMGFTAQVEDWP
jgi:hypothetical protein